MAIYADKKAGKPTGRWRVEVQRRGINYKKRWDSFEEAKKDELAVIASFEATGALPAPGEAPGAPDVHTFSSVIPLAKGMLWEGQDTEVTTWARLEHIADLMGRTTRLDDVDTRMVDSLIAKLRKEGKADGTINRYLSHLRTFLVWAKERKYRTLPIKDEIAFSWKDEAPGRIRWITPEEEKALEQYLTTRDCKDADRAVAVWKVIKIAIKTGCRRDELLTVELDQINGTRLHLWDTKTDDPRTVPMTQETTDMLTDLVRSGTMPTRRSLRSWWDRAKEAIGLAGDTQFVFHVTRHTCATRLVDARVNVFVIKTWMGHKRIETTLRYAHVRDQNLEDALAMVGEYESSTSTKSLSSNDTSLPHASPTAGENGGFNQMASAAR